MQPIFSLVHMTARVPNGWQHACSAWLDFCAKPDEMEYVLSIHRRQNELPYLPKMDFPELYRRVADDLRGSVDVSGGAAYVLAINLNKPTMVENGNAACLASSGKVLIDVNDDLFPCPNWDEELLKVIPDLDAEFVVKVNHGTYCPEIITHPIVSRKYWERIGLMDTQYLGYGVDDELTEHAYRDGVVIEAPHIYFEHRHWSNGGRRKDSMDLHNDRNEVWAAKKAALAKRRKQGFPNPATR